MLAALRDRGARRLERARIGRLPVDVRIDDIERLAVHLRLGEVTTRKRVPVA